MVQGNKSPLQHAELQNMWIRKDEDDVSAVVSLLQGWINPFSENQELISISTAKAAPCDLASDLKRAFDLGKQNYESFMSERLESDPPVKRFHDKMKMNKLKSFTNLCKKKEVKSNGRTVILKADRSLFGRIIVMAQVRDLQMADILSYPLGPLPWALATPDGLPRKRNKSSLATLLQKNVAVSDALPNESATVIDGMCLVQRVKGDQATFGDIAKSILSMALKEGYLSNRIDIVFDPTRRFQ